MTSSIIICTRNRRESLLEVLDCIKKQTVLPQRCIVIENIREHRHFSQKKLDNYFRLTKIKCAYWSTTAAHVATSRNIGLKSCSTDIGICVDDDVLFSENLVSDFMKLHSKYPNALGFVGKVLPTTNSMISRFGSWFCCGEMLNEKKLRRIDSYSAVAFSYTKRKVIQSKVKFKEDWSTGEDIDFFTTLREKDYSLYFHPSIQIKHKFRKGWFAFMLRHHQYASCYAKLAQAHPQYCSIDRYLPYRKLHWLFLPWFWLSDTNTDFHFHLRRKSLQADMKYIFFLNRMIEFITIYCSPESRPYLWKNFRKRWGFAA